MEENNKKRLKEEQDGHDLVARNDNGHDPSAAATNGTEPPPTKKPKKEDTKSSSSGNKKQKKQKKQKDPNVLRIRRDIQQCCKMNDLKRAWTFYQEAQTTPIHLEPQTYYNLLNLCDGLEPSLHIGTPKPYKDEKEAREEQPPSQEAVECVDVPTRLAYAEQLRQDMTRLSFPLTEPAYSALIRLYCKDETSSSSNLEKAASLLKEAEGTSQCKKRLRLYSGLLEAYCNHNSLEKALDLWKRLDSHDLFLSEREFASLLGAAIRVDCSWLVRRILSELSEDCVIPSKSTTKLILDWFTKNGRASDDDQLDKAKPTTTVAEQSNKTANLTDPSYAPPSETELLGPVTTTTKQGWTIHTNVGINSATGALKLPTTPSDSTAKGDIASTPANTGTTQQHPPCVLQPVKVPDNAWRDLQSYNSTIVTHGELDSSTSRFQGGGKGPKRQGNYKERQAHWTKFQSWLKQQQELQLSSSTKTTTIYVLDGANIGYYKQNFSGAPKHVCYQQIDLLVQELLQQKQQQKGVVDKIRVVLMLHERHFLPRVVPKSAQSIIERWTTPKSDDSFVLYKTPFGCNDDWFWVGAALYMGSNAFVVTNDEMRDHHFQMLETKGPSHYSNSYLTKWKERHQIHFEIFGGTSITFQFPAPYSRRIQYLDTNHSSSGGASSSSSWIIPMPKRGDENRFLDGCHVANEEDVPEEELYICIVANEEEEKKNEKKISK